MSLSTHKLWPVWREPAQQMLRAMLGEVEGLAITGGESSVRFSPAGIDRGRWLVGFSPAGVSPQRLMGLPQRLGMPADGAAQFLQHGPCARQIYLSVEQAATQVVAKVYWEHALPGAVVFQLSPEQRQVALHIASCKWCIDAPNPVGRPTEYWRMSGLSGAGMVDLLRQGQDLDPQLHTLYAAAANVLDAALQAAPLWRGHRLLLVREPGSQRHGMGLRFYGSEFRACAVLPALNPVFQAWGFNPEHMSDVASVWTDQELGWLHAGLDANAHPYVTVYGALNSANTRAVLMHAGQAQALAQASLQEN